MKKIIATLLLVLVIALVPAKSALACNCGCSCCDDSKKPAQTTTAKNQKKLAEASEKALKPVRYFADHNGWTVATKTTRKNKTQLFNAVTFHNDATRLSIKVTIRNTINKSGKITTTWVFKSSKDGQWHKTSADGVKRSLLKYGEPYYKK